MRIDIVSVFPEYFEVLNLSLFGKAQAKGLVEVHAHNLRGWTHDVHHSVDDTPVGGGAGMVMKPRSGPNAWMTCSGWRRWKWARTPGQHGAHLPESLRSPVHTNATPRSWSHAAVWCSDAAGMRDTMPASPRTTAIRVWTCANTRSATTCSTAARWAL